MKQKQLAVAVATMVGACFAAGAMAAPIVLNQLYDPFFGGKVRHEGYLQFINPTEHPQFYPQGIPVPSSPPGVIQTEEYTGYTQSRGQDIIEGGDSDTTAGDRADFDWVQENRACETSPVCNNRLPVNHPNQVGAMGWMVGPTQASLHIDPGTGQPHNDGQLGPTHSDEQNPQGPLPHLVNGDYRKRFFDAVDVFSIISLGQDDGATEDPATHRAAALDYVVDFTNTVTGAFSPGVLSVVWIPGWTPLTFIDDYVARWVPLNAGLYDVVAIEPPLGVGDERVEIDAIKALHIPEPGSLALLGLGLAGLGCLRRRVV